jgi:hypothetical protein
MRIAEKILAIIFLIGIVLKFSLIPVGEDMALIALLILACIYYPLGFLFFNQIRLRHVFKKQAYENVTAGKIVIAVLVGIALSIVCVGVLFKILILPGGAEMVMLGVVSIFFLSIIVAFIKSIDRKFILIRAGILVVFGVIILFISELSIIKLQYRNHPAYVKAYIKYKEDPQNPNRKDELDLEYNRIWMSEEDFKEYEKSERN